MEVVELGHLFCLLLFRAAEASNRIVLLHLHYDTRFVSQFLADRTFYGQAIVTLCRSSVVCLSVCNVVLWLNGTS